MGCLELRSGSFAKARKSRVKCEPYIMIIPGEPRGSAVREGNPGL